MNGVGYVAMGRLQRWGDVSELSDFSEWAMGELSDLSELSDGAGGRGWTSPAVGWGLLRIVT